MPSPPTLFDDDGEPSNSTTDPAADTPVEQHSGDRHPNYLVRRAIVVGGVVAVVATAAIVIGRLIGSGADAPTSGAASAEWNRIVTIDGRTGRVVVLDESGEETERIESGLRGPTDTGLVGSTALLTSDDTTVVVDVETGDVEPVELVADEVISPSGSTLTMIAADPAGRRGLLVHGPTGDLIDTDEFVAVTGARYEFSTSLADTTARHVLVTDTGNFQSVLFSFDRDEPAYVPGLALALDADIVVTAQNVGNDATVSVFDHAGEPVSSGRTTSVRAAMVTGDTVLLVTVEGEIIAMSTGSGDTATGSRLEIGTIQSGQVTTTGDRLVIAGTEGTAVIDSDGDVVASVAGMMPFADDDAVRGSTCVALRSIDGDQVAIIDMTTGDTVAEAEVTAERVARSADGCTVVSASADGAAGYDIIAPDGVERVDDDVFVALAPDASHTVVERDGRLILTPLTDDAEPVDLAPVGRAVEFTRS